jgi:hypothetical protein
MSNTNNLTEPKSNAPKPNAATTGGNLLRARQNANAQRRRDRQYISAFRTSTRTNEANRLAKNRQKKNKNASDARAAATNAVRNRLKKIQTIRSMSNATIVGVLTNLNKRNNKQLPLTRNAIKHLFRGMKNPNETLINKSIAQAYINRYNKYHHNGKTSLRAKFRSQFLGGSSRASAVRQGFSGFGSRISSAAGRVGNRFKVRTMSNKALINANNAKRSRNAEATRVATAEATRVATEEATRMAAQKKQNEKKIRNARLIIDPRRWIY